MAELARVVVTGPGDDPGAVPLVVALAVLDMLAARWPATRLDAPGFSDEPNWVAAVVCDGGPS